MAPLDSSAHSNSSSPLYLSLHQSTIDGRFYTLTVGRVLNTNVFQINLGELLFRATQRQARLMFINMYCTKTYAHFQKFTACLQEGLIHEG